MDEERWLSVADVAKLYNQIVDAQSPTLRRVSARKVRDLCANGGLAAQGIGVQCLGNGHYIIHRESLVRAIFDKAARALAHAAQELDMPEGDYCAVLRKLREEYVQPDEGES